jgi:PST family polysaccharide transporter
MNLKQKAVKGVFWSAIQSWGSQGISFLVFALLARLLAPETFGLIALAGVFLAFIEVFLDQGFSTAIIQRQELETEHLDTAFWTNLAIGIFMTGVSIAAANLIASFFHQPELASIIRWLSLSFIIRALSAVQEAIFLRNLAFKALAIRSLIAVIVGGMVGVSMAFMGFGVWSLVGQILTNSLVQIIVLWWASDWRPKFRVSQQHFQDLLSFGINIVGINMLTFLITQSDNLLIGYFLGPVALGYYNLAYRLLQVTTQLFVGVISKIAVPLFSRLQQEPKKMRQVFYRAVNASNLIAFPLFLGISVLAPEIVVVSFGEKWLPSVPVIQILNLIGILYAGFYFNGPVLMAVGKPSWKLRLDSIKALGYLITFAITVRWGIVAVAIGYVATGYLMSIITIWVIKKVINIDLIIYLRQYTAPLISSFVMVMAIIATKYFWGNLTNSYALLSVSILIGAVIYFSIILITEPKLCWQTMSEFRSLVSQNKKP